jgi:hypothetical protein
MPKHTFMKQLVTWVMIISISVLSAQEINWFSIDQGGGVSQAGDVVLRGVIGQSDEQRLEGASITLSGGFLPLPADLIFEDEFE